MSKNEKRKIRRYIPIIYFEKLRRLSKYELRQAITQNIQSGKCISLDEYLAYLRVKGERKKYEMTCEIIKEAWSKMLA